MLVKIRYKTGGSYSYDTEDITIKVESWDEVFKHVKQIEKSDTVVEITRVGNEY